MAYNDTVFEEIREVFRDIDHDVHPNNFERNQYYTDYLSILKTDYSGQGIDNGEYQSLILPDNYVHLINDSSMVIASHCVGKKLDSEKDVLKPNTYYRSIDDTKYLGVWYKNCDVFKSTTVTQFYGKVEEIPVKKVANRLIKSEHLHFNLNSNLNKTKLNSPISELTGSELRVYKKNFDIASVGITYIRKPKPIAYHTNPNEVNEFRDNVIKQFINKTVQRLSIRTEQPQQKIVNLKGENFENL